MDILIIIIDIILGGAVLFGLFVLFLAIFYALNP
jgi:hypothetical protein